MIHRRRILLGVGAEALQEHIGARLPGVGSQVLAPGWSVAREHARPRSLIDDGVVGVVLDHKGLAIVEELDGVMHDAGDEIGGESEDVGVLPRHFFGGGVGLVGVHGALGGHREGSGFGGEGHFGGYALFVELCRDCFLEAGFVRHGLLILLLGSCRLGDRARHKNGMIRIVQMGVCERLLIGIIISMNALERCLNCTEWVSIAEITCPYCDYNKLSEMLAHHLHHKNKTKIQCPSCHQDNDLSNELCVFCESPLYAQKEEEKLCQYCGHHLPGHLYAEHTTNCMLSKELIEEEEKQMELLREIQNMKSQQKACRFCGIFYPPDLLTDHGLVCPKKPKPPVRPPVRPPFVRPPLPVEEIIQPIPEQPFIPAHVYQESEVLPAQSIGRLTQLQYDAISYMHKKSNRESNAARVALQKRARRLGYKAADLQNLQFYVENYAPVIIHIYIMRYMEFFLKDTHYRNQFETGKSSGSLSRTSRVQWEDRMFDKMYSKAKDFERVKYGVINMTNDPKGVNCATSYGPSYFLLKQSVRGRCTLTDMDSSSANAKIGTFRECLHILEKMNDRQLISAFKAAKAMEEASSVSSSYKEIQIHGPIEFGKDIERLYVNKSEVQDKKYLDMVYEFSEKFGVPYEFI